MHSRATDRRSASKCQGKWPDQTLDQAFGLAEVVVAVSTSRLSCKRAGKTRTLMPVWDSSGESRLNRFVDVVFGGPAPYILIAEVDPDQETFRLRCKPLNAFRTGSAVDNA